MGATGPVRSMTGYGDARGAFAGAEVVAELWSLNHRYFDFIMTVPEGLQSLEIPLRKQVAAVLPRGRVRLALRFLGGADPSVQLAYSEARAATYIQFHRQLKERHDLPGSLTAEQLLFAPHVIYDASRGTDRDALIETIGGLVKDALLRLDRMQRTEGKALTDDLLQRVDRLQELVKTIRELVPTASEAHRKALETRVASWKLEAPVAPERIATEIALFADRTDVTEELVRLDSHLAQVRQTLETGGEVGHRLDFLAQECNREINTTGSKSQSAEIAKLVVSCKEEMSKIREQIQNLV
jgi:uncharacterized protein (TIGR00255 family)